MNKPKKTYPGKGRKNCSLALHPDEILGLRTIMSWMITDPEAGAMKIGHQSAVKYAIAHTLAHPPQHVRGGRG